MNIVTEPSDLAGAPILTRRQISESKHNDLPPLKQERGRKCGGVYVCVVLLSR